MRPTPMLRIEHSSCLARVVAVVKVEKGEKGELFRAVIDSHRQSSILRTIIQTCSLQAVEH